MGERIVVKVKDVDGGLEGAPLWITTFVDMTSLLVTFFILLFTFSAIRDDSFAEHIDLTGTTGIWQSNSHQDMVAPKDDIMQAHDVDRGGRTPHARPADELPENIEQMGQKLTEEHVEIDLRQAASGLRVVFPERAGFAPGEAFVNEPLRQALRELGGTLQHYPHVVLIEGHTDAAFVPTPRHPSAHSLSLARAVAAAEVLLAESDLPPALVQVTGQGAARPRSGGAAGAVERRIDRRVEVVIVAMERGRAKLYQEEVAR